MLTRLFICMMLAGLALTAAMTGARASSLDLPVLRSGVRQGEVISADQVIIRRFPLRTVQQFSVVATREELVGRVARRSLQPGVPVPATAVAVETVIKRGEPARLIFREGGLQIIAQVEALQNGSVGSFIRARNIDSGLIITGRVQPDGSILVGD
ncbi:flagellar basal body P-ring formation chaperone FlgA [Pannonibacter sp. Q-1]|uniref:Flagella basal body P-ring formation protein FlgA n=1 Tax=Pannonibacter phragmitetus TaxID=121719 RepID=A0A0L0IVW0_9HYPH|nr:MULTISPECIES: flagellar basal body P-ring formation chaperone FlgA [Pannonibacter]ALV26353.1 flagellar biosynthesis protein FlgA [Pannonibacter phragmitetus]KND17443.1 flagellar basal body P-ring biosynthesis protein FlgA [Pannonibacter phragmitetus]MBA4205161.1 flagella basal body P-ring formation protein FlgA [Polymorphum sp.]